MPVQPGFQSQTGELPPQKGGCLKAGLIGCGVVALLVVLVFVGGVLFVRKNPGILLDFAMTGIEQNFGPDVTEKDKKELRAAVEEFKEAIRSKRTRSENSDAFGRSFRMRNRGEKLTHEDVQELIRMFRAAAGKPVPPGAESKAAPTMVPMREPTRSP